MNNKKPAPVFEFWDEKVNTVSSVKKEFSANFWGYWGFAFGIMRRPAKPINYAGKASILKCYFLENPTNVAEIKVNP